MTRYQTWLAALAGITLFAAAGSALAGKITIAATVNDEVITSTDLAERRALVMVNNNIPETPENAKRITGRIIEMLLDETLQLQEAKRQSITISDQEVASAMDAIGTPALPPGTIKQQVKERGLSLRSLERQVRAQLSWAKVVQRKLRRNVTITQDELNRAQAAQNSDRGIEEMRLAVMAISTNPPQNEAGATALAKEIAAELATGRDMPNVASKYAGRPGLQYSPLLWVNEERTPPALYAMIKDMKPGQLIGPVKTGPIIQFVKMLERRITKKPSPSTEVLVKQITIEVPTQNAKDTPAKLAETKQQILLNPGSCDDAALPATPLPAKAAFARTKMAAVPPDQQAVLARLEVGMLSEAQVIPGKLQYLMLCERSESAGAATGNEMLRQELFAQKMELEAQKHLRNLRRDATIDIRGEQ